MPSYRSPQAKEASKVKIRTDALSYYYKRIERDPLHNRRSKLRCKYGLTVEQVSDRFIGQGSRCAACGATAPGGRGWQVHHSHKTNKFLAVLCCKCNRGSGLLADSPVILRRLAEINEE